jgi:hypothetical protein
MGARPRGGKPLPRGHATEVLTGQRRPHTCPAGSWPLRLCATNSATECHPTLPGASSVPGGNAFRTGESARLRVSGRSQQPPANIRRSECHSACSAGWMLGGQSWHGRWAGWNPEQSRSAWAGTRRSCRTVSAWRYTRWSAAPCRIVNAVRTVLGGLGPDRVRRWFWATTVRVSSGELGHERVPTSLTPSVWQGGVCLSRVRRALPRRQRRRKATPL